MTIAIQGGINATAFTVPDIYVNVQAPPAAALNGVPSNVLGIVGTASWGPVNSPVIAGDPASYARSFGAILPRKYDLGTAVLCASLHGPQSLRLVRVTDGTDTAANNSVYTAKYTGTRGNQIQVVQTAGSATGSLKVVVSLPGQVPEVFDNIAGAGNIATAINLGQSATRGPSQLIVASAGATPNQTLTLTGGTDGAVISSSTLLGADATTRTGMYALRGTGAALFMLADCDDSTTWAAQLAFALSEQMQAVAVSPAGDTIAGFTAAMNATGLDNPWIKVLFGDWCYFNDSANGQLRLVSPQAFYAGWKAANSPEQSALNKQLLGIVATQRSSLNQVYSSPELQALASARGDVITNPVPGGSYFGCRFGRNSSSDPARHQDCYTTLTNYIAVTLNAGAGKFVGRTQSPDEKREAKSSISSYLDNMWQANQIGDVSNPQALPYSVQIDALNNPDSTVALGIQKATALVKYLGIIEYFLIDLTGGTTVQIAAQKLAA